MTQQTQEKPDRASRQVRIREPMASLLERLADRNGTEFQVEANRAAVLLLRQEGLLEKPAK